VQTWEAVSVVVSCGFLVRMLYVAIMRHYRNRGWPSVDRRQISRRRIDRKEMNRIENEYGKDREDR
jgi:hypothetical protein